MTRRPIVLTAVVLAVISVFPLIAAYGHPPFLNDDSYITLTYAKNLADGRGFAYNHPPQVLGTTTPLFALAVAGLAVVFRQIDIQTLAVFLSASCWIGIVWTFFLFRRTWKLNDWQAAIIGLTVIGSGRIWNLGMEAYLFAFLLVLSFSLYFSGYRFWAGLVTGLLFLTRGEGILAGGIMLAIETLRVWRERKRIDSSTARPIAALAAGLAIPLTIWFVYAQFTFGHVLPNTLAAKQAQLQNGLGTTFLKRLTEQWVPAWGSSFLSDIVPFASLYWWMTVAAGIVFALRRRPQWLAFAAWSILYASGYVLLNVSAYGWYHLPILFSMNLFFGLGAIGLVEALRSWFRNKGISKAISVVLTGTLLFLLTQPTVAGLLTYQGDHRGSSYTTLARWFRENTKSSESIAYMEIGYLGYFTENRIIDLAGLTLPDIVMHVAVNDHAWGFWHYQPDYYVHLSAFDWAFAKIRPDPRFDMQYQAVASFVGPGNGELIVYRRVAK